MSTERLIANLSKRIATLEREAVRVRMGTLSDVAEPDVDLGAAGTDVEGVPVIAGAAQAEDDPVAVLTTGRGLHLMLGSVFTDVSIPYVRVTRASATYNIPNNTGTAVPFTAERYDESGMWTIIAPTRLTVLRSGPYLVWGNGAFAANSSGVREFRVRINGTTVVSTQRQNAHAAVQSNIIVSTLTWADAGDYFELIAYQNSGGGLNLLGGGTDATEFAAVKL